jgi:hypothetical protein
LIFLSDPPAEYSTVPGDQRRNIPNASLQYRAFRQGFLHCHIARHISLPSTHQLIIIVIIITVRHLFQTSADSESTVASSITTWCDDVVADDGIIAMDG